MDLNLARTFLEIVETRNFAKAADRLHVTQTAVSARVRSLEELLGRRLFVRNKAGAALTPAGERFVRYARTLVQAWEQARHQVAVPPGKRAVVTMGCEPNLWDPLMLEWLLWMRRVAPQLAVRTEVAPPGGLLERVADGTLEVAVVYAPQQRPGLKVELLIEEKLMLVTTARRGGLPKPADYVFVDWGPEFAAQHHLAFPQFAAAATNVGLGERGAQAPRERKVDAGGRCAGVPAPGLRRLLRGGGSEDRHAGAGGPAACGRARCAPGGAQPLSQAVSRCGRAPSGCGWTPGSRRPP